MMKRLTSLAAVGAVAVLGAAVSVAFAQQGQPQHGQGMQHRHHDGEGQGMMQGQAMRMGGMQCPHCKMATGAFSEVKRGKAALIPTEGSSVRGIVTFEQQGPLLVVTADVRGLEPNSKHGFHIHEFGDISAPDGTAAGGHYAPDGMPHALPHDPERHAGDLGNLEADAQGRAQKTIKVRNASLVGMNPVLGRAVIVHAQEDTGVQPTGGAGDRLAQGVIGVDKPAANAEQAQATASPVLNAGD